MAWSIDISFLPPLAFVEQDFREFGLDVRSFREPLTRSVRQVISPSIGENFAQQGRPSWPPLREATIIRRQGGGGGILHFTGLLERVAQQLNIWEIDQEEAVVNELPRAPYGAFHQFGTTKMEPRPFLEIQDPEDIDGIEEVFINWLAERLAARGFSEGEIADVLEEF